MSHSRSSEANRLGRQSEEVTPVTIIEEDRLAAIAAAADVNGEPRDTRSALVVP
ncbi:MAG TPA: hypothetical protein VMO47_00500 [Rhodothermales bacterium]|nr:hypothetical protein [Rhodothermales bacterium]